MVQFFLQNFQPNFNSKMGHFGVFQVIKNNTVATLLTGTEYLSREASNTIQQSSRRVKSPKTGIRENTFA